MADAKTNELRLTYNGWWSKLTLMVVGAVCSSIILGGLGGIIVTLRGIDRVDRNVEAIADHEVRLRSNEKTLHRIEAGVEELLALRRQQTK